MTDYIVYTAIVIAFAAVRVMRGGLGPQPPRWLMVVMPPAVVFGLTMNVYVAAASAALSAQFVSGYGDKDGDGIVGWEDAWWDMALRCVPTAGFVLVCAGLAFFGLYQPDVYWIGAGAAVVFISNVAQPDLRVWADRLPGHGNRYVEGLEGAALGILCVTTSL